MKPQKLEAIRERANLQCGLNGDDADDLLAEIDRLRAGIETARYHLDHDGYGCCMETARALYQLLDPTEGGDQ